MFKRCISCGRLIFLKRYSFEVYEEDGKSHSPICVYCACNIVNKATKSIKRQRNWLAEQLSAMSEREVDWLEEAMKRERNEQQEQKQGI